LGHTTALAPALLLFIVDGSLWRLEVKYAEKRVFGEGRAAVVYGSDGVKVRSVQCCRRKRDVESMNGLQFKRY